MSKPNRIIANLSKRPWMLHGVFSNRGTAQETAERLRAEGNKVRITSYKYGSRKEPRRGWNVWTTT